MKKSRPLPPRVLISGIAGTGKDATAEGLAERLEQSGNPVKYVSVGTHVFRSMALKANLDIVAFGRFLAEHPEYEMKLDATALEILDEHLNKSGPGVIMTSRVLPFLLTQPEIYPVKFPEKVIRIRFDCSNENERLERIARREFRKKHGKDPSPRHLPRMLPKMQQINNERDHANDRRYKILYGTDNVLDDKYFHTVIDSRGMSLAQQVDATYETIMHYRHIFE